MLQRPQWDVLARVTPQLSSTHQRGHPIAVPSEERGCQEDLRGAAPPQQWVSSMSLSQRGGATTGHSILLPHPGLLQVIGAVRGWHPKVLL